MLKECKPLNDINPLNAKLKIEDILYDLKKAMGEHQYGLYGTKNAWIVKPGAKSRGKGIAIHSKKDELVNYVHSNQNNLVEPIKVWITQKYIESPLIIKNRKFDIRQWVSITNSPDKSSL